MTITINGTTGLAGVDGSAGTPAIQGGDTNTGMFFPAADTAAIATGGTERMRLDSSGNLQFNSGYGSVATAYGVRAWVYFSASRTIQASANVSSLTVIGTGDTQINFATAMPDANFCALASTNEDSAVIKISQVTQPTTAKIRYITMTSASAGYNCTYNFCAVIR